MTRRSSPAPRRRAPRDPYGLIPSGTTIAPLLALGGLAVVAILTLGLLNGNLPFVGGSGGGGGGGGGPDATPAPSNVVVVPEDPRAEVPGSIVYVKQGSLWIQSGSTARQLTAGEDDSDPAWSPDGEWIYFIRTKLERGRWPSLTGRPAYYTMSYPLLMRISPDGETVEELASGKFTKGDLTWFYWMRQPTPNPAAPGQLAILSDGPDPTKSNVVLQFFDLETRKLTRADVPETQPFGHQDPSWHPRGTVLTYVRNDRDGRRGAPSIWRHDPANAKFAQVTGPGYLAPAYSPDGLWIAATKTSSFGTDVVILDARDGSEILRVTDDGDSWSPVWSPRGDAIAFHHVNGQIVDLRMVTLEGTAPAFEVAETIDLTKVSGLDGSSRPTWWIPPSELPPPSPPPSPSPSPSPAASPSP